MVSTGKKGRSLSIKQTLAEMRRNYMAYIFIAPFMLCFLIFVVGPVASATLLAFTSYDSIQAPRWNNFANFVKMFTQDIVLMKYVIPNTITFAVIVGPIGYMLQFLLAWLIVQAPKYLKKPYIMAIYTPSIAGGVLISVVWAVFFSSDRLGYLNDFLINIGAITSPVAWTQDKNYLLLIMILVTLWGSMGVGFLSLYAGMQNVDQQLYEAGKIDGIKSPIQELFYITIPSMKPQMLFSAVMAIVNALKSGSIGVQLSGSNPTPNYAGQLIQSHVEDYGFARFELGYATTLSFTLLIFIYILSQVCFRFLGTKEGE
jgi:ABC-type sugar transport systems, permease components